jgi:uncharacterized protein
METTAFTTLEGVGMTMRLVPEKPFPPYTFVPGRSPHPFSDPAGHSFGVAHETPAPLGPEQWQQSQSYLYGIDLFNGGFFWESHDQWEGLWHAAGRKGTTADFLKGLIKLAAAGVKYLEGKPAGVTSHATRAAEHWREVAWSLGSHTDFFFGFLLQGLIALAEEIGRIGWPQTQPYLLPALPSEE